MDSNPQRMVADVGGTNSRLALFDPASGRFSANSAYENRLFSAFDDVIQQFRTEQPGARIKELVLAVASPPTDDRVEMTNLDWRFSVSDLAQRFGFERYRVLNDFEAVALSLPHLQDTDVHLLQAGQPGHPKLAALGPGTGLGGATCETTPAGWHVRACEPGHMGLSPLTALEWQLFQLVSAEQAYLYTELLVSGPGLERIYSGLTELEHRPRQLPAAEISERALAGTDDTAVAALDLFCAQLGSVAGDFVLANGAYGGLYLAGGIIPRMLEFLASSAFLQRFCGKGAMAGHMARVPVYAITLGEPALLGAAHAAITD